MKDQEARSLKMISSNENIYQPEGLLIHTPENREYLSSLQGLERAMQNGKILEANVLMCDMGSRLLVDLMGIRGYIDREECMLTHNGEKPKDIAIITRVGKPVCFKVMRIEYDRLGPYAVLSRREAQVECMENYASGLIPGDIIPVKVTHIENFGAFVDIGCGIASLLSIDSISVSRISHPSERLSVGMLIYTVVKMIDRSNGRLFVSMRELLGTWNENASEFKVGSTVAGIIRSVESYGIFVELAPNLAGLAELRESMALSFNPEKCIGDRAAVYIKSIIPEKMKVKLVLIDHTSSFDLPSPIKYYTDVSSVKHIDRWVYSPSVCNRTVESIFES